MALTVAILAVPGVQALDVAGPLDVFAEAGRLLGRPAYAVRVVGETPAPVRSAAGLRLVPDATIAAPMADLDTLLVAGAPAMPDVGFDPATLDWLREGAARARRFGSVCSGAFALAAAGLLDGRRVTTHWRVAAALARRYPRVTVDQDQLYVRDGALRTSGGVTAGMDLALALVEEDYGRVLALQVASHLVLFFRRPGGQAQFRRTAPGAVAEAAALADLQRHVLAHPAEDHAVAALAARVGLSPRHLARVFTRAAGVTPAAFVEAARVDAARRLLEETATPLKQVAARCGFADPNGLRRAFLRRLSVTPGEYRKRFQAAGVGAR